MTCNRCHKAAAELIGGFFEQHGDAWCLACCDAAGLTLPHVLRQPYKTYGAADRAQWAEERKAKKRAALDTFLASRRPEAIKTASPIGEQRMLF
jgi:hypothetical protein